MRGHKRHSDKRDRKRSEENMRCNNMGNFLKALFGNYSKRELKRIQPLCDAVLALEDKLGG